MNPQQASNLYYVAVAAAALKGGVNVGAFRTVGAAEAWRRDLPVHLPEEAHVFRHSKKHLDNLPVPLLIGIARAGASDGDRTNPTSLKKDELVDLVYGRLWSAYLATGATVGASDLSTTTEEDSTMSTTIGKGPKVKEIRDSRKNAKAAAKSAPKAKATAAPKAASEKKASAPRANAGGDLAGKTLVLVGDQNPRREGTHGFKSMEVIRKAGSKGISYDDAVKNGARRVDILGSIELGQLTVK
jgi:hypothetical protein